MENNSNTKEYVDIESLMQKLKQEDTKTLKKLKNFKWLYIIMVIFYTLLLIINPDSDIKTHHRISGLLYVCSFTYLIIIIKKGYQEFSKIDYSLTVLEVFQKAVKRYNLKARHYLVFAPPFLLLDAGLTISGYYWLNNLEPFNRLVYIQIFFFSVILLSGYLGYLSWKKKYKPFHEAAKEIIKELSE